MAANLENSNLENSGHGTGKSQLSFQSQRRAMPKNVQTTAQLHSFHTPAELSSQDTFQQYMNEELPDVQAVFRKGREARHHIETSVGS